MVLQAEIQRYRDIKRVCVMCVAIEKIEKGEREREVNVQLRTKT